MTTVRVMTLRVLRPADFPDCTNGGASARLATIDVLCDEGLPREVEGLGEDAPEDLFELEVGHIGPTPTAHLVPVRKPHGLMGPMAGGNYATTSDSRWARFVAAKLGDDFRFVGTCLPIHDRYETQAMYDVLSR